SRRRVRAGPLYARKKAGPHNRGPAALIRSPGVVRAARDAASPPPAPAGTRAYRSPPAPPARNNAPPPRHPGRRRTDAPDTRSPPRSTRSDRPRPARAATDPAGSEHASPRGAAHQSPPSSPPMSSYTSCRPRKDGASRAQMQSLAYDTGIAIFPTRSPGSGTDLRHHRPARSEFEDQNAGGGGEPRGHGACREDSNALEDTNGTRRNPAECGLRRRTRHRRHVGRTGRHGPELRRTWLIIRSHGLGRGLGTRRDPAPVRRDRGRGRVVLAPVPRQAPPRELTP